MKTIGIFEAKTNLSKIAESVARTGQAVTFTRRGEPLVDLVPHTPSKPQRRLQSVVIADIERLRKTLPKTSLAQITAAIDEGRR